MSSRSAPTEQPVAGVTVDVTLVAGAVAQRPPRRRQRLLHLGHRAARKSRSGHFTRDDARRSRCRCRSRSRQAGRLLLRAVAARTAQYRSSTRAVVLRARCGLHGVGSATTTTASICVPEQETYKPGETARLMIQSPWEQATALLTVEREGIRSHTQFALTSTQQTVDGADHGGRHPESVRLGAARQGPHRKRTPTPSDTSDPGKPAFRLGYAKLDRRRRVEAADGRPSRRTATSSGPPAPPRSTCR